MTDKERQVPTWLMPVFIGAILTLGAAQLVLSSSINERTNKNEKEIIHIKQNYVDATMFSLFVRTFEIQQEEILGIKEGDIEKVISAQAKYRELRSAMANIQTRSANETK
jgi:hypothetical protein